MPTLKHLLMLSLVLLSTALLTLPSFSPLAEDIYRWVDKNGNVHYSSEPNSPKARPAELPPIMRAEMKLPKAKVISCSTHGGVDCEAGADSTDGSVICYDGFKDASAPFRMSCSSPKISVSTISEPTLGGVVTVVVRNSKAVTAKEPLLAYLLESGEEVALEGPDKIDGFGMAEFTLNTLSLQKEDVLKESKFKLSCANCQ